MSTTKKQIGMTILRQNNSNNESIDSNNNKNANTSSCNSINNIIIRKNVYLANMPTSKSLISSSSNSNNNRNNKNDLMVKNNNNNNNNNNNSAYLTTRRCLNKKSQLNINSNSKNSLNNELENNYNNKNINSYINKLSLAINNKQIHKIEEEKQKQKNNFSNQHFNGFNLEKSKLESRNNININNNNNNKNPIVSVLNNSNISTSRKVSKASVESYLKPFYLNEFSKCEKENTTLIKTKKSSIKELKISNITNIQASLERYETNQQNQQQQDTHQLDTPIIYLNSSLNTNFSLNRHNNNTNSKDLILNNNDKLKKNEKFNRPASINSLDNIKSNKNDSIASFDKLKFNEINHNNNNNNNQHNNQSSQQNMLSSQTNIVNASTNSFRLTQSHKEKNSKSYTLKSNKSLASSSSSSQNLISSLNQNQINKFINNNSIQSSLIQPSQQQQQLPQTSKKSAFTSMKQNNLTCTTPNKSSKQQIISNQEYEGGLVEKMASFIDELKDFIDDRLIDTTSQLELANQRISGLYFNLNYLTSELINLKKQNEELKKEVVFKNNNTNRSFLKDHQYLDQYSDYAKKIHTKTTERYIDSSCMKIPDSSSNLESTMNNSTSKTSSPETTSASSTSTSTSLIISQTPLESLYIKKANTPPNAFHHHHHNHHHKQQQKQQHSENQPKTSKDFKSGKHFEILNDLELKRREKHANNNSSKIQSSSSSINSINFYDNMSIVNRFEINWPTRSNNETTSNDYPHRTSSPSQIDLNNLMQTQYASTDFDHDDIYENNDKNYDIMATSQSQHSPDLLQHANESLNFEANSSFSNVNTNKNDENISLAPEKDSANDILLNQNSNLVHHLHASIVPYNNLIADFDTQYIWDYESNGLVNKYSEKSDNIKFEN